ncbi:MAG: protein kinase [Myxococcales bacterium]|nr:protein kinase [Myxococcales bacterium]
MSTFRIARRLGEAASVVEAFVGTQEEPHRPVVVKRLVTPWAQNADFAARFLAGGAPPRGPGLPELYEVGTSQGVTYLVQELIEGESLRHVMNALAQRKGFIAPAEGLAVVSRLARLLMELHARTPAVVHGDVCASATLLTARGEVFLLDAQVAVAAGSTTALGPARAEPFSVAPEQLSEQPTAATDVFRLGLLLHELALGRPLFAAADATQALVVCQRYLGLKRDALKQVPEPYASLLLQLLAPEPKERPSLEEVDAVLQQAALKAGWKTPELDVARLFARACPDRVSLSGTLQAGGHVLTLTTVGGAQASAGVVERPSVTPPGSAVVARIATRKMSRSELQAVRLPEDQPKASEPEPEDTGGPRDAKLGAALLEKRAITRPQLEEAMEQVHVYGGSLSDALQAVGVDEDVIVSALAELTKTPSLSAKKLAEMTPGPEALKLVSLELARALDLVPLALKGGTQLMVAMKNPMDADALEQLKAASGLKSIVTVRAGEKAIRRTRNRFYTGKEDDDIADFIERGSSPSALLSTRATASQGSGIFEGSAPPPVPSGPPRVVGQLLDAPEAALAPPPGGELSTLAALRMVDTLLALLGDKGKQAWQLMTVAVAVAERLGVLEPELSKVKLATTAVVVANLRDGRPPWDVPTIEALSGVLGPAWDEVEHHLSPLLAFPASVPDDAARQAVCVAIAFATHVGQAKPLAQVAGPALTSFKARFRFPAPVVAALAAALGVSAGQA